MNKLKEAVQEAKDLIQCMELPTPDQIKAIEALVEFALDKTENIQPETFMGYKIEELQKIIQFAKSRGFVCKKPGQIGKMFPVSKCCSAGARFEKRLTPLGQGVYICSNCRNMCELKEWSKPKKAEPPDELVTSEFCITEPTKATQFMIVDKINAIIRYLRERDNK